MASVLLPAEIPQFTTYQCDACPAIVMAGNPTADNWYFNNGLQIKCNKFFDTESNGDFELSFVKSGYSQMKDVLEYHTLCRKIFVPFASSIIHYCLSHGYYVYIDCYDEFYLENARLFQKRHCIHDCLIYGYDCSSDEYNIAVYTETDHFGFITSSRKSLEQALESEYITRDSVMDNLGHLCAMRVRSDEIVFDRICAKRGIKDYLCRFSEINCGDKSSVAVGAETGKYLLKYLSFVEENKYSPDMRISLFYVEHKRLLFKFIKKVESVCDCGSGFSCGYEEVIENSEKIHLLFLKINMTDNYSPIEKIKTLVERNITAEGEILSKLSEVM